MILGLVLLALSSSAVAEFTRFSTTNKTAICDCQLVAPLGKFFRSTVPLLEARGTEPFRFIEIETLMGDRFLGYQFADQNLTLLWAGFLIRDFIDSDLSQNNFVCYQEIRGDNISVGYSLHSSPSIHTVNTNVPPSSTNKENSPHMMSNIITTIIVSVTNILISIFVGYRKAICAGIYKIYQKCKYPFHKNTPYQVPKDVKASPDSCVIPIDTEKESTEHRAIRVGAPGKDKPE